MKRLKREIALASLLIVLSAVVYLIHYGIFRDARHIFLYFVGDVGFVFIEVLLVTLIIDRLLSARENRSLLRKLNMVIGAFFSEVGTELLKSFAEFDPGSERLRKELLAVSDWSEDELSRVERDLNDYDYSIDTQRGDLEGLRSLLRGKRDFLLGLLQNPNLLEHESFTELHWAVFHLSEELNQRVNVKELPETDHQHLARDMKRVYISLVSQWMTYMKHLSREYPYLFSLAMRTNPFDPHACPEVK